MMGKRKGLLLPPLSGCTAFCSTPIPTIPDTENMRHRFSNPTLLSSHSGKDLDKPQGVDHPEINFY